MPADLRHLRTFIAVAEAGGIGAAADRLYVSQPAVSQTILQLEREVGTDLLRRHARGVELTPAGEAFLADARRTVALADGVGADAAGRVAPETFVVSLLNHSVPIAYHVLAPFLDRHPGLRLDLRTVDFGSQFDGLLDGDVDLGVLAHRPRTRPEIETRIVLESPVIAHMADTHPLAAKAELTFEDIADELMPGRHPSIDPEWADVYWLTERRGRRPRTTVETPLTPDETWALIKSQPVVVCGPLYVAESFVGQGGAEGSGMAVRPVVDVDPFVVALARRAGDDRPLLQELFAGP